MVSKEHQDTTGRLMMRVFEVIREETRDINVALSVAISVLTAMVVIVARKGDLALTHKILDDVIRRLQHLRTATTVAEVQQFAENVADGSVDGQGKVEHFSKH